MSGFPPAAVAVAAAFMVSSSALAAIAVEGNSVTFAWRPSSGPVSYYSVHLAGEGRDITHEVAAYVSQPRVTVHGQFGETIRVRVVAWVRTGRSLLFSMPSPLSEKVRFVEPASAAADPTPTSRASLPGFASRPPAATGAVARASGPTPPGTVARETSATSAPVPPPLPAGRGAAPYDFDGDGRTDLLWRNKRTSDVAVWLMSGTSPSRIADLGTLSVAWNVVGSGDFDGDGLADLLLRLGRRWYEIWFMNGGSVRDSVQMEGPSGGYTAETIGDFDGDGYADLLWKKGKKQLVWFMRGSTVDEAVGGLTVDKLSVACAPDLDGDGRSDVIWHGLRETVAWLMGGSWAWRSGPAGPRMQKSSAVGCGDADGDGLGDVLWYQPESRSGTLWLMDGDIGVDLSLELPQLEARWAMEASGDFDGDGFANDILLRNVATGRIAVWQLRWNRQRTSFSVVSTRGSGMGDKDWEVVAP